MATRQKVAGGVVTAIGVVLVALGIFADHLPFAPDNLFLPIMLIFVGRAISRQQKAGRVGTDGKRQRPAVVVDTPPRPAPRVEPARRAPREEGPVVGPSPETVDEPIVIPVIPAPRPIPSAHPRVPTYRVRSSEDMIAEAKERLKRKER